MQEDKPDESDIGDAPLYLEFQGAPQTFVESPDDGASSSRLPTRAELDDCFAKALAGDPAAQFSWSVYLKDGRGVGRDWSAAIRWLRSAAEGGHATAEFALALAYRLGALGLPLDHSEALKWANLAADQGLEAAQRAINKWEGDQASSPSTRSANEKDPHSNSDGYMNEGL